jgi:predicted amidohydrolase
LRLALAQINSVVGDLGGNAERILARLDEAKRQSVDVILFPELIVTGYPPEDLLLRPGFVRAADRTLEEIARRRPERASELAAVPGVGPAKLERYAGDVLAVLARS